MRTISTADGTARALSLLGLARASGELIVGQDNVFRARGAGRKLLVIVSRDCSENVLRRIGEDARLAADVSRESLGGALGLNNVQIAALPEGSGFAKKLKELLRQGGTLNQ
ncbi:MAG: hypothetical protein LBR87_01325 [Synergistaceae bacterium]|nr:hypothetical protein [Synergistaceae bacterium]